MLFIYITFLNNDYHINAYNNYIYRCMVCTLRNNRMTECKYYN